MKNIFSALFLVVLISSISSAENLSINHENCSSLLVSLEPAARTATEDQMENLLSSVNSFCLQSVEFSEWVNEVLYSYLIANPNLFIESYQKQPKEIQENIIKQIGSPVNDGIDLKKTYLKVISLEFESHQKRDITNAILSAAKNIGIKIE